MNFSDPRKNGCRKCITLKLTIIISVVISKILLCRSCIIGGNKGESFLTISCKEKVY